MLDSRLSCGLPGRHKCRRCGCRSPRCPCAPQSLRPRRLATSSTRFFSVQAARPDRAGIVPAVPRINHDASDLETQDAGHGACRRCCRSWRRSWPRSPETSVFLISTGLDSAAILVHAGFAVAGGGATRCFASQHIRRDRDHESTALETRRGGSDHNQESAHGRSSGFRQFGADLRRWRRSSAGSMRVSVVVARFTGAVSVEVGTAAPLRRSSTIRRSGFGKLGGNNFDSGLQIQHDPRDIQLSLGDPNLLEEWITDWNHMLTAIPKFRTGLADVEEHAVWIGNAVGGVVEFSADLNRNPRHVVQGPETHCGYGQRSCGMGVAALVSRQTEASRATKQRNRSVGETGAIE